MPNYAVSISLGASSSYVAVAPVNAEADRNSTPDAAPIKVIANSSGHRNTPVVAALTEQEVLFGDNALHQFARQPQTVVPYLFTLTAAAASIADSQHNVNTSGEAGAATSNAVEPTSDLLQAVEAAAQQKFKGHCQLVWAPTGAKQLGFEYVLEQNGEPVDRFVSAEDLFIRFLNYVKEHSVDGVCGLTVSTGGGGDSTANTSKLFLTLVVPRYAFPEAADSAHQAHRASTVEWLKEAVLSSHFGAVVLSTNVVFSDEAAVMAYDSAMRERQMPRLLSSAPHNVLVVDWGVHAMCLTLLCCRGGVLVCPPRHHNVPFRCFTRGNKSIGEGYFAVGGASGGDALDVALAERVAAQYITQQRRIFASPSRNLGLLLRLNHMLPTVGSAAHPATQLIQEAIPSRAMRRLALLLAEKKVSLNTNPPASSVSVEVEAFYEGMDLMDTQTLTRNKLDNAIRIEWGLVDMFNNAVRDFADAYKDTWAEGFVDTVLFAGGMCQMASLIKSLTASIQANAQSSFFSPTVRVLDFSVLGNGVCADELFAVGGCQHSCCVADAYATVRTTNAKQARKGAGKLRTSILNQVSETATKVWETLTKDDDDESSDEDEEKTGKLINDAHSGAFLRQNLYLYIGDPAVLTSAAVQTLPSASLHALLGQSTALPCRIAIPWTPCAVDSATVLYFFTDATVPAIAEAADTSVDVRPAHTKGITIAASAGTSHGGAPTSFCIVVTAEAKWSVESQKEVRVSVQLVRMLSGSRTDMSSVVLTPGNICSTTEFALR